VHEEFFYFGSFLLSEELCMDVIMSYHWCFVTHLLLPVSFHFNYLFCFQICHYSVVLRCHRERRSLQATQARM